MALVRQLKTAGFMPKSRYNTFVDRPPTCQHSWHVKKFVQQYKLASLLVLSLFLKLITVMQLSLVQLLQKYSLHA